MDCPALGRAPAIAATVPALRGVGSDLRKYSANPGHAPCAATDAEKLAIEAEDVARFGTRKVALRSRAIASSTGWRSSGERLMTPKHLASRRLVFERLSVSSRVRACTSSNSRVFSMAMTAWSAKVCSN